MGNSISKQYEQSVPKEIRKQDGVFYTPDNVVRYLVAETIGAWLADQQEIIKTEIQQENKVFFEQYLEVLKNIKVLDLACGGGDFLVVVFDYLKNEYENVLQKLDNQNFDIESHILQHNIYGVDLSAESVEITKLSLWLKTVQRGKILSSIESNIQQGNSLIDDEQVADKLAFRWHDRFAAIMNGGGFDVIVGNPPYGTPFSDKARKFLDKHFQNVPDYEAFYYFISRGLNILKSKGFLGYIFPNTFLSRQFGEKYRLYLLENFTVVSITDLSHDHTFEDASVRTCMTTICKDKKEVLTKFSTFSFEENKINTDKFLNKSYLEENISNWLTLFTISDAVYSTIKKIRTNALTINNICEVSQGYIPYRRSDLVDKYGEHGNEIVDKRLWHSNTKLDDDYKQEILGKDIRRYYHTETQSFIKYSKEVASYVNPVFFESPRVLIREIGEKQLICTYLEEIFYNNPSIINVIQKDTNYSLKYVLGLLNAKLLGWYHYNSSPKAKKGLFPKILVSDVRKIPIPKPTLVQHNTLVEKVDFMLAKSTELNELNRKFLKFCDAQFDTLRLTERLKQWYLISFKDFNAELKKQGVKDFSKMYDFISLYEREQAIALALKKSIDQCDREIDALVYALYELTPAEIAIIESGQ